jgi:hypothetical protein
VRDTIVGLAMTQLASLVSSDDHRKRLETAAERLMKDMAAQLPAHVIR